MIRRYNIPSMTDRTGIKINPLNLEIYLSKTYAHKYGQNFYGSKYYFDWLLEYKSHYFVF